jgi:hypothetical protein
MKRNLLKIELEKVLEEIPEEEKNSFKMIYGTYRTWVVTSRLFRMLQTSLGVLSVLGTVLVASTINYFPQQHIFWIAVATAVFTSLLSSFSISNKSNNFMNARRSMQAGLMKYYKGHITIVELIKVYEECENKIGDVKLTVSD